MSAVAIRDNASRATNKRAQAIIDGQNELIATLRANLATAQATVKAQAAQIEAMELERGELILARDYARDEA